ncbi:hypothetical protein ACFP3U_18875 [Kitasatospora misakiensis]|uniref:Uncharacterized protein n=1 Tax=Kitasatospora misakiensis TaxID=67330 RepID=A0ABW0X794_9ACTN
MEEFAAEVFAPLARCDQRAKGGPYLRGLLLEGCRDAANKAAELVRMAEALYLDGTAFEGAGPAMEAVDVPGGMFHYFIAPRLERVFVVQVTAL